MTLIGVAVADAWGVPFEMQPWFADALLAWDGGPPIGGSPFHDCLAGQYSDDTQMSLALAETLIESRGYNINLAAQKYLAWADSGQARGMGKATRGAMKNLRQGIPPTESGILDAQGNGTAMRAVPLSLWYWRDTMGLKAACQADSRVTHNSDEAVDGQYAVAAVGAYALASAHTLQGPIKKVSPHLISIIRDNLPCKSAKITDALNRAAALASAAPVDKVRALADLATEVQGGVPETVATAVAALLLGNNYAEVVEMSIRAGGDTDTRAAIAGGLTSLWSPVPPEMQAPIQELPPLRALDSRFFEGFKGSLPAHVGR